MSEDSIEVLLVRLDHLGDVMNKIHEEVKRTNGRVTELEMQEARWQAKEEAKKPYGVVITTVIAYGLLAVLAWFVGNNI